MYIYTVKIYATDTFQVEKAEDYSRDPLKHTAQQRKLYSIHMKLNKHVPLILVLLMDVKDVIPHLPTVPADLAADGRLLFSRKSLSNCILPAVTLLSLRV